MCSPFQLERDSQCSLTLKSESRKSKHFITKYPQPDLKLSIRSTSCRKNSFQPLGDVLYPDNDVLYKCLPTKCNNCLDCHVYIFVLSVHGRFTTSCPMYIFTFVCDVRVCVFLSKISRVCEQRCAHVYVSVCAHSIKQSEHVF